MKSVVYTTIFGGSDSLKPAPLGIEAVCFVDDAQKYPESNGWEMREWLIAGSDPRRSAWHVRCISHELFPHYDRTIWIDASHTLTNPSRLLSDAANHDISALRHHRRSSIETEAVELVRAGQATKDEVERQLADYRERGYQSKHLSVSCIIVRTNSDKVRRFNERWDDEIQKHAGDNTQLSLDYSAWRQGLAIRALKGSRHDNPYASHDAADHKKRRKPYRVAA